MKNKGLVVCVIMLLFLGMTISSTAEETTFYDDDLDVNISAGNFGLDIGIFIKYEVVNNRNYNVTVNYSSTFDFLFLNSLDSNESFEWTFGGNEWDIGWIGLSGFVHFSLTFEGGNTKVTRKGICLWKLIIFYE